MTISHALAHEVFNYDPLTGELTWAATRNNRCQAGSRAGTLNRNNVWQVCFDRKTYFQHRIIWLYMTGDWPKNVIDHIDGDPSNNCWNNLRDVTQSINRQNLKGATSRSASGYLGVFAMYDKWYFAIKAGGVNKRYGPFVTPEVAHCKYLEAKRVLHKGCTI